MGSLILKVSIAQNVKVAMALTLNFHHNLVSLSLQEISFLPFKCQLIAIPTPAI